MTDYFVQFAISNSIFALILALVALTSQLLGKLPRLTHMLWLLVLLKLITPPIFTIPAGVISPSLQITTSVEIPNRQASVASPAPINSPAVPAQVTNDNLASENVFDKTVSSFNISWLILLWCGGSLIVACYSWSRILRFNRLLKTTTTPAPEHLQAVGREIGEHLNLSQSPLLLTTSANISPMVWWLGGRVQVIVPAALARQVNSTNLWWMLAHELVHVKRRDYLVRWLEYLAIVLCWWNPLTWLAQKNLRVFEEISCDNQVLENFKPQPKVYAHALLSAVEFLSSTPHKTPAIASGITSGESLERRLRMIVSVKQLLKHPRWLNITGFVVALGFLPMGLGLFNANAQVSGLSANNLTTNNAACGFASQDYQYLVDQVESGELSGAEALALWEQDCGQYQGTQDFNSQPLNVAHHLWILANRGTTTSDTIARADINGFACDEIGYEYLVDLVHDKSITPQQGLNEWEIQCGEYSGERIDKSWKKYGLPRHHLWYMAHENGMGGMQNVIRSMFRRWQSSEGK